MNVFIARKGTQFLNFILANVLGVRIFSIFHGNFRERGMLETLPHKTVEEFTRDVVHTKPSNLEEFLLSFTYFMPVIA